MSEPVSIFIPSLNGKSLLKQFLPAVIEAAHFHDMRNSVNVIDDGSSDGSTAFLRKNFPEVRVVALKKNRGFGKAVNYGVKKCENDIFILLNNDIEVEKDFIGPLIRHFEDKKVFAVTAKSLTADLKKNESVTRGHFSKGDFIFDLPTLSGNDEYDFSCTILHGCAGFSAYRKKMFLSLGGFDSLFLPFYWEDFDLSYRAWKNGWKIIYEPKSVVHHKRHQTIQRSFDQRTVNLIYERNRLMFMWKNFSDPEFLTEHIKNLLVYVGDKELPAGDTLKTAFYEAFKMLPEILKKRKKSSPTGRISDRSILKMSANIPLS